MSPRRAPPKKKEQQGLPSWVIPAAVVVVLLVVVVIAIDFVTKSSPPPPLPTSVVAGVVRSGRTEGDANAPITFVEFSDFQWPYCRDFAVGAGRQIEESYVKQGKVKFSYKFFPVVDQGRVGESTWAAQAAECANQQGKFWEYHDKLFAVWAGENVGTFTKPKLKQYAADLQLDTATFNQCLDSDKTLSVVQADTAEATRMGVNSTPSFFVNNRPIQLKSITFSEFSRTFDSLSK